MISAIFAAIVLSSLINGYSAGIGADIDSAGIDATFEKDLDLSSDPTDMEQSDHHGRGHFRVENDKYLEIDKDSEKNKHSRDKYSKVLGERITMEGQSGHHGGGNLHSKTGKNWKIDKDSKDEYSEDLEGKLMEGNAGGLAGGVQNGAGNALGNAGGLAGGVQNGAGNALGKSHPKVRGRKNVGKKDFGGKHTKEGNSLGNGGMAGRVNKGVGNTIDFKGDLVGGAQNGLVNKLGLRKSIENDDDSHMQHLKDQERRFSKYGYKDTDYETREMHGNKNNIYRNRPDFRLHADQSEKQNVDRSKYDRNFGTSGKFGYGDDDKVYFNDKERKKVIRNKYNRDSDTSGKFDLGDGVNYDRKETIQADFYKKRKYEDRSKFNKKLEISGIYKNRNDDGYPSHLYPEGNIYSDSPENHRPSYNDLFGNGRIPRTYSKDKTYDTHYLHRGIPQGGDMAGLNDDQPGNKRTPYDKDVKSYYPHRGMTESNYYDKYGNKPKVFLKLFYPGGIVTRDGIAGLNYDDKSGSERKLIPYDDNMKSYYPRGKVTGKGPDYVVYRKIDDGDKRRKYDDNDDDDEQNDYYDKNRRQDGYDNYHRQDDYGIDSEQDDYNDNRQKDDYDNRQKDDYDNRQKDDYDNRQKDDYDKGTKYPQCPPPKDKFKCNECRQKIKDCKLCM